MLILKDQLTVDGLTVVDDNLSVTGVARAGESAQGDLLLTLLHLPTKIILILMTMH